jgi:DNA-binding beta-propeller fold protein YncE
VKFVGYFIFLWVAVVACPGGVVRAAGAAGYAHFEGRQTHPVAMTPDKTRLLAVNTPDGRLSVFDISDGSLATPTLWAEIQVGLEPVSVRARTDNEVWVVNEASDTVSVIRLDRLSTVATLRCPDEPSDVVFAQGKAFVSCARNHAIRVFDVRSHAELSVIDLQGHYPRALVTDGQEERVYAAFQFSGNSSP